MKSANVSPPLDILLCAPRGFCAGVDRAIQIVELALKKYGPPVFVRHEIVHNRYVVDGLRAKGAVFIEELDEIPTGSSAPVIFSAHGVAKSVPETAEKMNLFYLDATCPLVSKVHISAEKYFSKDKNVLLIGHAGHPEVIGTTGQLPDGAVTVIETIEDAKNIEPKYPEKQSYITQTTLSVDDTRDIVKILKDRFPKIQGPGRTDICYATTNRQDAVKQIAGRCDTLIIVGASNSSNSQRLREVAERDGCKMALLIETADDLDWEAFGSIRTLGISAGASAPEILVEGLIDAFRQRFDVHLETITTAQESVAFKLPALLQNIAAE